MGMVQEKKRTAISDAKLFEIMAGVNGKTNGKRTWGCFQPMVSWEDVISDASLALLRAQRAGRLEVVNNPQFLFHSGVVRVTVDGVPLEMNYEGPYRDWIHQAMRRAGLFPQDSRLAQTVAFFI